MSLRFNLDNESDRMAWEHLQSIPDSKNKAVIDALNASFEQANTLADLIRQTIRECLSTGTFVPADSSSQAGKHRRFPKMRRHFSMRWTPLWETDGMKVMPFFILNEIWLALL